MAFIASKRKTRPNESDEAGELNIIPYLDILMNLIIFILLSMTGLATFGSLNVSAARHSTKDGTAPTQDALLLTVGIAQTGYFVATAATGGPSLPKKTDGTYDYVALNETMKRFKADHPNETKIIVSADKDLPYDVLVATMDAVRETADHQPLFRDVTLAAF